MKTSIWLLFFYCFSIPIHAQYYLRGDVKGQLGRSLEGAKIVLSSKVKFPYYTGSGGAFGIQSSRATDTMIVTFDGYEVFKKLIDTRKYQSVLLTMLPATARLYKRKLVSQTPKLKAEPNGILSTLGESYSDLVENTFVPTHTYPETGFALNIDKASYSNIRRFLNNEMAVPADAIRIEEMLNYFDLCPKYKQTLSTQFGFESTLTTCPWESKNRLLFLHISAPKLNLDSIPPSNLVFLIDISGSMDKPNRLPLLQSSFKKLAEHIRPQDTITIVTYGGGVGIALAPTGGAHKKLIRDAIDSLTASGDTPGPSAIKIAYELAKENFIPKGNNRVILATDGDFNVGPVSEKALGELITTYRQSGIYLTCLGVGMGNYKDSKLETLAKKGNGNFAYIDHIQEAEKVLITEFTTTFYSVASDAFLHLSFDPAIIQQYRLIGFDNKKNAMEDSTSELDGGEIGSGHNVMALFELEPKQPDSLSLYQPFAKAVLQYKTPGTTQLIQQHFTAQYQPLRIEDTDSCYRFTAALTLFGSVLKQSPFTKSYQLQDVLLLAKTAADLTNRHQREFLTLIEKAIKVYQPGKRKKGK